MKNKKDRKKIKYEEKFKIEATFDEVLLKILNNRKIKPKKGKKD